MGKEIVVREAKPEDKEAVLSFCQKTWEWGDYIPKVWDRWIKDPAGKIFVGIIDGKPVGITNVIIVKEGEAWLRGARTHPDYRRKGVITAITLRCLEFAVKKGAKLARLVTESTNIPAQKALEKLGFKPIAKFIWWETENFETKPSKYSSFAKIDDLEQIWRYLEKSECFRRCHGLYAKLYLWISLEKETLRSFIDNNKCIKAEVNGEILGLTLIDDEVSREWQESSIQVCYIDGNFEAVADMLKFLKKFCKEKEVNKIYAVSSDHPTIIRVFEHLGFKREEVEEIVYEKVLTKL